MKKLFLFICTFAHLHICTFFFSFAQTQNRTNAPTKIDSLQNILKTAQHDTTKINTLNALSREFGQIDDYEKAMQYAKDALALCDQLLSSSNIKHYISNIQQKKAIAYNNIGIINKEQGNYDKALENFFASLKIKEESGDKQGIATSYNNIGAIYQNQDNYDKALENYIASLKIKEEAGDKKGIAVSYNNIGNIYISQGNNDKALENYVASLKIKEEIGDKKGIAASYNNIGVIYGNKGKYAQALENHFASLKIRNEIGDKKGIAASYINIGNLYLKQKKIAEAKKQSLISLSIAKEIGAKESIREAYQLLSICDSTAGNWKGAYEYHKLYSEIKDSIFNEESSKQIAEMQTKYETEKKEQQIKLLNKDKEIQSKDLERQKTIRNAVAGGLLLVLFFSFVLINRLLLIRKQKKLIEIEREKSEKLLLNILPKEIAEELKRNTTSPQPSPKEREEEAEARSGGKSLSFGEGFRVRWLVQPKRYEMVTVMFTDFKGFTTIAEKMSAEELVSELDFIFKKFDEIISKYPIEKIKTIGDAYMCAGGLPVANTTNPMDVVLAALEIQEFMEKLAVGNLQLANEEKKLQTVNWKLRIGVHTGSVIAGVVGDKKFAYDIWGDTVNTASRMESSGEAGKVNISGATYKFLAGARHAVPLRFTFRGKIPAKNKGEIEMYFVSYNHLTAHKVG